MVAAITILSIIFAWILLRPVFEEARRAHLQHALNHYRDFQAFAVLKYHPAFREETELRELTIEELRREYNLSALYQELGGH